MTWLLRLAALVAFFFLVGWLWRWFWTAGWKRLLGFFLRRMEAKTSSPPAAYRGRFQRDPICGTYVDPELAVTASVKGDTVYFCSERCRDSFRARQQDRVLPEEFTRTPQEKL